MQEGGVKKNISMCKLEGRYEGPKEGRDNKQAEQGNFITFWFFKRKLYLRCYIQKTKKLKNYKYGQGNGKATAFNLVEIPRFINILIATNFIRLFGCAS